MTHAALESPVYSTGSAALDAVLGGGVPTGSMNIVAGLPGTGKTILAEQFLFANATPDTPAVYLTTLSEPLTKLVRYLQRFTFFRPELLPGAIHYQDIGQTIREQGVPLLPRAVEDLVLDRGAQFVVIDSFKALHDLSRDPVAFRSALFDLGRVFAAAGTTALLVGEYGPHDIATLPEFAVADGVLELTNRPHGVRDERTLRVHKMRGSAYLPGEHTFRIDRQGIRIFPRLIGEAMRVGAASAERTPTSVPGLDVLLDGGLWRGSATLVAGPSGVGKTMLGLQYLLAGARIGEPGLLVAFQESPAHLRRAGAGFGADLGELEEAGLLRILYVSPLELDLVELFSQITDLIQAGRIRRLVLDPLDDMREAAIDRSRFRSMVWSLVQYLERAGVTGLLLTEVPMTPDGPAAVLSREDISYMADNVLVLRYVRPPRDGFDRALEVIKTRGSAHDPYPHPYRIGAGGAVIQVK